MAKSPAHKFGQIIGDVLETSIEPLLKQFADEHKLYLDKKGQRNARKGKKVSWTDSYGNVHDLDFVLERDGSATKIGTPVAFIESAWRRYTKHSRNKAQEIQGAILPLVTAHRNSAPFIGVMLAGIFTEGALTQLRSVGFNVLYFPYKIILEAFRDVGIDANFDEETLDDEVAEKIRCWEALPEGKRMLVIKELHKLNLEEVQRFMEALRVAVMRQIESIRVLPLHGSAVEWDSIEKAIEFVENYQEDRGTKPVIKYEIEIRYNNGDRIEGNFADKMSVIQFLRSYQPPALHPF